MNEELRIDKSVFTGEQEDIDALKIAVEKLATASQEQFEEIKNERWYTRVFDMVTFSKKNEKRLAEQVSTVAQAQQILMELLLRLSSDNKDISMLVANSFGDIQRLSEQNIYLLSKIKQLENVALGIKCDMDINTLSESEKKVLCACLYQLADINGDASEEQKQFANTVISYLGFDIQMENPTAALANMGNEQKKKVLACCMEYIFLKHCTFDSLEVYEEFIEEFDFGNKTINDLKKQVETMYSLRGTEGFYSKYIASNYVELEDVFYLEFEEMFGEVSEEEDDTFSYADILYLQQIMEKYGIARNASGYMELAEGVLGILPDAYLGKIDSKPVYFTTQALYVKFVTDEWRGLLYSELNPEGIINDLVEPIERGEVKLTIPDINDNRFVYTGSKEECDKLTALLYELKNVKTSEYDQYSPTWLYENAEYAQILVDFLKLGKHSVIAALVRASDMVGSLYSDEDDILFEEFCKQGLSQYTVTTEELKEKILEWKDTLDVYAVDLCMAILVKDLIEVLQMATGEPSAMTSVEKYFFDWLLKEAKIEDTDEFLEMVRLPFYLLSPNRDVALSYNKIMSVENYAYKTQMHIPYHILDNEKNGVWSALNDVTKEYNAHLFMTAKNKELVQGQIDYSMFVECCGIYASMYIFLLRACPVEPSIIEWDDFKVFIGECISVEGLKNMTEEKLPKLFGDEEWNSLVDEYLEYDRRGVGKKMVDILWLGKGEVI